MTEQTHQEFLVLFSTPQMAIEKYNTDLSALTKTCEEMKKLYSVILVILELLFQYLSCTASEMNCPAFQWCIDGPLQLFVIVSPHPTLGDYIFQRKNSPRLLVSHQESFFFRFYTRTHSAPDV